MKHSVIKMQNVSIFVFVNQSQLCVSASTMDINKLMSHQILSFGANRINEWITGAGVWYGGLLRVMFSLLSGGLRERTIEKHSFSDPGEQQFSSLSVNGIMSMDLVSRSLLWD